VRPKYKKFESKTLVNTNIFQSLIPGGMLSNMESQLEAQGAGDRMDEVMKEVPRDRKDAGYPPLVTPSSQIVGTQAVFNVLMGNGSYKNLTAEFADLMLGYYGKPIGELNPRSLRGPRSRPARSRSTAVPPTCSSLSGTSWSSRPRVLRASTAPTRTFLPTPCSRELPRSSSRYAHRARRASR